MFRADPEDHCLQNWDVVRRTNAGRPATDAGRGSRRDGPRLRAPRRGPSNSIRLPYRTRQSRSCRPLPAWRRTLLDRAVPRSARRVVRTDSHRMLRRKSPCEGDPSKEHRASAARTGADLGRAKAGHRWRSAGSCSAGSVTGELIAAAPSSRATRVGPPANGSRWSPAEPSRRGRPSRR